MRNIFDYFSPRVYAPVTSLEVGDVVREADQYSPQRYLFDGNYRAWYRTAHDHEYDGVTYSEAQIKLHSVSYASSADGVADGVRTGEVILDAPLPPELYAGGSLGNHALVYFGFQGDITPRGILLMQYLSSTGETAGTYYNVYLVENGDWLFSSPQKILVPLAGGGGASVGSAHPVLIPDDTPQSKPSKLTVVFSGGSYYGGAFASVVSVDFSAGGVLSSVKSYGPINCVSSGSELADTLNDVHTSYGDSDYARGGVMASVLIPPSSPATPLVLIETKPGTQLVGAGVGHPIDSGAEGDTVTTYAATFAALHTCKNVFAVGEMLSGAQTRLPDEGVSELVTFVQLLDSTAYTGYGTSLAEFVLADRAGFVVRSGTKRQVNTASGTPEYNAFSVDVDALLVAVTAYQAAADAANLLPNLAKGQRAAAGADVAELYDAGLAIGSRSVSYLSSAELRDYAYIMRDDPRVAGGSMLDAEDRSVFSAQGTCVSVTGEALAHSLFSNLAFNSSAVLDGKTYLMTPEGIASLGDDQCPDAVLVGVINTENNMRCGQLRATASASADSNTKMKLGSSTWYRYPMANTPGGARAVLGKGAQGRTAAFVVRALQGDVGDIVVDVSTDSRFKKG